MKNQKLFISILLLPILFVVITNQFFDTRGQKGDCSWSCHDNTDFCKQNHVKFAKPFFEEIDPIYFGVINVLKSTGDYGMANVVLLVFVLPLMMYILLMKSINIELKIRKIKNK